METMIEARALSRVFGDKVAVDSLSFTVARGEVLGFLGPNGAGKSTTMKMLTGFLTPSGGSALVAGFDTGEHPTTIKTKIGYLPENAPLYPEMKVNDFLRFIGEVRGLRGKDLSDRIDFVIEQTSLSSVVPQRIETLSKGYKRRVGLAQAILHDPEVLILDEPTDGLDPNQKFEVRSLIKGMSESKCIIVSTHILEEVDAICSRAIIIAEGKLVADGSPAELKAQSKSTGVVVFDFASDSLATQAYDLVSSQITEGSFEVMSGRIVASPKQSKAKLMEQVLHALSTEGVEVLDVRSETGQLDQVFREVTTSVVNS